MKKYYDNNYILIDTIIAIIVGLFFIFITNKYDLIKEGVSYSKDLFATYISLGGFLIATIAIIFSFKDGERFEFLKNQKGFGDVIKIFYNTVCWLFAFAFLFILSEQIDFYNILEKLPFPGKMHSFIKISYIVIISYFIVLIKIRRSLWVVKEIFYVAFPNARKNK